MRVILLSAILSLVMPVSQGATFSGNVRDSLGAVISGARVVIHWDSSGSNELKDNVGIKKDIEVITDANGQFSLELPAGFYDIFVSAAAFSPHCEKIRVRGTETKAFSAKLKINPLIFKELD